MYIYDWLQLHQLHLQEPFLHTCPELIHVVDAKLCTVSIASEICGHSAIISCNGKLEFTRWLVILFFVADMCNHVRGAFQFVSPQRSPNKRFTHPVTSLSVTSFVLLGIVFFNRSHINRVASYSSRSRYNHFSLTWFVYQCNSGANIVLVHFQSVCFDDAGLLL